MDLESDLSAGFARLDALRALVMDSNACALPGCSIVVERFLPVMWRAVSRGYVHDRHAQFVQHSLLHGFDLGFDPARLSRHGRIVFRAYKSATDNAAAVAEAVLKRVAACKTVVLGEWRDRRHDIPFDDCLVFPCGAVEKNPLYAPGEFRPVSDHTKSGFNAACAGDIYRHVLATHKEVAEFLRTGYVMAVSDVDGAFPILPLAPFLWPFMLFLVALRGARCGFHLCCHLFADFGTRHAPGAFYIFFVRVVLPMARSEMVLTLCSVVHVDDLALIGECAVVVDAACAALTAWCERVCGVAFKVVKTLPAASRQLYVGLWWDSNSRSLELEERRLRSYIGLLFEYGSRTVLSLHDRQSIAGKMQRAVLTLPPGAACLIQAVYGMMAGLYLPWQRRRTSRLERFCYRTAAELLTAGHGRGFFDRSHLPWAPAVMSDASKSARRAMMGFVSACGAMHFQQYGPSAARGCIDELEGDAVEAAAERLGAGWRGCRVPFGVDNQAFERSQARGRSRVERLMVVVRRLFFLQLRFSFVLEMFWLSSEDNLLADLLSRDRLEEFWHHVSASGFWDTPEYVRVRVFPDTGRRRVRRACIGKEEAGSTDGDGPRATTSQATSVAYTRTSLWEGLPASCSADLERVLDNRLGSSSLRSMAAALKIWFAVCALHSFDYVLATDDPMRGGAVAAFVLYMVSDTTLVWASIENYVWAWREWMVLQRQGDPIMGVMHWDRFINAVKVLTIVPNEPRVALRLADLECILSVLDLTDFYEVQFGLFLLVLLFTFSRSECPCPQTLDGFDPKTHWRFSDLKLARVADVVCLWVRFKAIKQDRRMERPAAQPTPDEPGESGDWAYVGDIPDSIFSVQLWATRLLAFGVARRPGDPFFLHRDRCRPLTYGAALDFLRVMQRRARVSERPGLHGLRVEGNNLSRMANGDELTQFHGGWLSTAGRSRYDRFTLADVVSIPARMLGRSGAAGGPAAPRDVIRFSHLERGGPSAGDPAQRVRGTPRAAAIAGAEASAVDAPVEALESGTRGAGVLLPEGFVVEERRASRPRSTTSRTWKVYRAPDGSEHQSRPAAWRYAASVAAAAEQAAGAPEAAAESPRAAPSLEHPVTPAAGGCPCLPACYCLSSSSPAGLPAGVAQRTSGRTGPSRDAAAALQAALQERGGRGAGSRTLSALA